MPQIVNEIKKLQKIAGILKEDNFDLSDNPLAVRKYDITNHPSLVQIVQRNPLYLSRQGRKPYKSLYGLAEIKGTCYMIDNEKDESSDDILAFKKGLSIDTIIQDALSKEYLERIDRNTYLAKPFFSIGDYLLTFFN